VQTLNSLFDSCFDEAKLNCAPSPISVFVKTSIASTTPVDPSGKTSRVDATLMNQGHECTGTNNQCNNTVLDAANKYECKCTNDFIPAGQNAPPQTCLEAGKEGTYCTSAGQGCAVTVHNRPHLHSCHHVTVSRFDLFSSRQFFSLFAAGCPLPLSSLKPSDSLSIRTDDFAALSRSQHVVEGKRDWDRC
jgi:hypothetical protein